MLSIDVEYFHSLLIYLLTDRVGTTILYFGPKFKIILFIFFWTLSSVCVLQSYRNMRILMVLPYYFYISTALFCSRSPDFYSSCLIVCYSYHYYETKVN